MTRLLIQPGYEGREVIKAISAARHIDVEWICRKPEFAHKDDVPIGDVDFCEAVLGVIGCDIPIPDFYPLFLHQWRRRLIQHSNGPRTSMLPWFVKSSDHYKQFPAAVVMPEDLWPTTPIVISEVVCFLAEWRYYVADGNVLATGWYSGPDDDEPAPELEIDWPVGWFGAVDFGRLDTGEIALVESHHPYACGWYGDDHEAYVKWLISGWQWMTNAITSL